MPDLVIPVREYIGQSCYNWLTDEMEWATNADDLRMAVEYAGYTNTAFDRIVLEIGVCYGGSVFAGLDMFHYLRSLVAERGITIKARVAVLAASMGTIVALAGDEIEVEQTAQFMVHAPAMETGGTSAQIGADLKGLQDTHAALRDIYVARTGQPADVVDTWMSQDSWLSATECLSVGLATAVTTLAPAAARQPRPEAQASARRTRLAGIIARAEKRPHLLPPHPAPAPMAAASFVSNPLTMSKPASKPVPRAASPKKAAAPLADKSIVQRILAALGVEDEEVAAATAALETTTLDNDALLYHDGPLAQGSAVYVDEALTEPAADGDYVEKDSNRTIAVAAGVVTSLTDVTAHVAADPLADLRQRLEALEQRDTTAQATMKDLKAEVDRFKSAVPPLPTPKPRAAAAPQLDAKSLPKPRTLSADHGTL